MLHIIGDSHAAIVFRCAAEVRGVPKLTQDINQATLVIIAQDTPTDEAGHRNQAPIVQMVYETLRATKCPVLLTSQVAPGFTRQFQTERLYCQAETLRIKDAMYRALNPEQFIIGCMKPDERLPDVIKFYLVSMSGSAPVIQVSYEEAEFSKIAINVMLAHQVTLANALAKKAKRYGCDWEAIKIILRNDKRIGQAYLDPGDWTKSRHLLRDYVWFHESSVEGS